MRRSRRREGFVCDMLVGSAPCGDSEKVKAWCYNVRSTKIAAGTPERRKVGGNGEPPTTRRKIKNKLATCCCRNKTTRPRENYATRHSRSEASKNAQTYNEIPTWFVLASNQYSGHASPTAADKQWGNRPNTFPSGRFHDSRRGLLDTRSVRAHQVRLSRLEH